jgi:aryl-phospho-beta-D-glucosidase BglC (GH1 family)
VGDSLAFHRVQHLRHGINLSMWYAQSSDYSAERLARFTTVEDFQLVKSLGFDHVRLSIDPEPLIAEPQTGRLRPEAMARLDKTLADLKAQGLAVVLDIHPEESWKRQLTSGDDGPARFYAFWASFATHFAHTDPNLTFFEILNEPTLEDLYRWQGIQARTVATIRRVAPDHTIIATASHYDSLDAVLALEPVRDEDVIYSFHDYEPMWFTHQGATWGSQGWAFLRNVPYPASPDNITSVLDQEPDERTRLWVERYGLEHWDGSRMAAEIGAVADWAQRRGVPLYCGEFGVYRAFANPIARAKWIEDMRVALEARHIAWSMWDYQSAFGIVTKSNGTTTVDHGIVKALGLAR